MFRLNMINMITKLLGHNNFELNARMTSYELILNNTSYIIYHEELAADVLKRYNLI